MLSPDSWSALLVGTTVAVYWARVLRLAAKMRRETGRAAHLVPPEPLGRVLRLIWYPVVIIWIAQPFLVVFAERLPSLLRPLYAAPVVGFVAAALALAALLATLVCWKRMGKSWRMGIDPQERTQLVVAGPYAYVRHPIYALSSLLMAATILAVPTPLMLVTGLLHMLLLQWESRREEAHLLRQHGPLYAEYRSRVGRFLPRAASLRRHVTSIGQAAQL